MKKILSIMFLLSILIGIYQYNFEVQETIIKSDIIYKDIAHINDILLLTSNKVQPISYTSVISLDELEVQKKKETFIAMILPSILLAQRRIVAERLHVESILAKEVRSNEEHIIIDAFKKAFKVEDEMLIPKKLVTHPPSLVLAQAAIESGWGSSRFFLQANNVFGVWSYNTKDNRIAAEQTRGDKTIYLKKYKTLQNSVYDYFRTLSTVGSYKEFREARRLSKDSLLLVEYLTKYSEHGDLYIEKLKTVIEQNDLQKYDDYQLEL
jgi:Bax protein